MVGKFIKKRYLEIMYPRHKKYYDYRNAVRQTNKQTMAFFCNYIMAKKRLRIPIG